MRIRVAIVLALLLATGCSKKKKPFGISYPKLSYTKSPSEMTVKLSFIDEDTQTHAVEGTLEVSFHEVTDSHEGGAQVCAGKAPVTKSSFDATNNATVTVALTGCPQLPRTIDRDIRVHFTPANPDDFAKLDDDEGSHPFTDWSEASLVDVPDAPEVAAQKELDTQVIEACKAKDSAKAAAVRAKVAPAAETAAATLAPPVHRALTALITNPDPCVRTLTVFTTFWVSGSGNFDELSEKDGFADAVRRLDWPKSLGASIVKQINALNPAYVYARVDDTTDPSSVSWPKLVISYRVYWKEDEAIVLGDYAKFPRLRMSGTAHFTIPPSYAESISLGDVAFDAAGQQVSYRKGEALAPVLGVMKDQLVRKLDVSPLLAP